MKLLMKLIISTVAVYVASEIIPGVVIDSYTTALVTAVVLGLLNVFVKPLLVILTLPITILTLGLFTLILNVFLIMLASSIVAGFAVTGFWSALLFGLVVSLVNSLLNALAN